MSEQPLIVARGLRRVFGALVAVEQFDLEIQRGEVVVIVGASGCGKSTFLNMLAGFIAPSEGEILLDGQRIVGAEPRCGMVFQNYALFPWKTVRKNVEFGPELSGKSRAERRELADTYIRMVGLKGFEHSYPDQLSGGMRQRVALARVLANKPEVLLCDEPFGALDAMTRQLMQDELLRIVQESGQTVVLVTHSIDEALILADRIAVMSARPGRIKRLVDNDLPRPRQVEVQLSEQYLALKKQIWADVKEEVEASTLL